MNKKPITVPKSPTFMPSKTFCVPEDILIYAFRYALGRHTYATTDVASELRAHYPTISAKSRNLIVNEIEDYLHDTDEEGASATRREWMRTLTVFQGKELRED